MPPARWWWFGAGATRPRGRSRLAWLGNVRAADVEMPDQDANERARLAEQLASWLAKYPEIRVETVLTHESAASALVEASRHAQLVVVGSRGHGVVAGTLLGSAGLQLLHHAECPVYIARPTAHEWDPE